MKHIDAISFQNIVDGEEFRQTRDLDSYSYSNAHGFDLADFLNQTSETGVGGDVIDPLGFFDVEFKFFPAEAYQTENTFLYSLLERIYFSGANKPKQLASLRDQLCLQLGLYVQSMSLPQIAMPSPQTTPTLFGEFPTNPLYVKPESNTFTMTILNTKIPLHDYIFYPWMREAVSPKWAYDEQPYTTANIYVSFAKHSNVQYVFTGARPQQIGSRQPTQEPSGEATRDVTMLFDYMFVLPATTSGNTAFSYANSAAYKSLEKSSSSMFGAS